MSRRSPTPGRVMPQGGAAAPRPDETERELDEAYDTLARVRADCFRLERDCDGSEYSAACATVEQAERRVEDLGGNIYAARALAKPDRPRSAEPCEEADHVG